MAIDPFGPLDEVLKALEPDGLAEGPAIHTWTFIQPDLDPLEEGPTYEEFRRAIASQEKGQFVPFKDPKEPGLHMTVEVWESGGSKLYLELRVGPGMVGAAIRRHAESSWEYVDRIEVTALELPRGTVLPGGGA